LRKPPDPQEIIEIAVELGVAPSFIEKDWYAVQLLGLIASIPTKDMTCVFSGGTSLSKGYGLIQRFSEDIDFKIKASAMPSRAKRRQFRKTVIDLVNAAEGLRVDDMVFHDGGHFFGLDIIYPQMHGLDHSLRPHLKLEMKFLTVPFPTEWRQISAFVTQFKKDPPDCAIECVSPVETAADKLSALIWRLRTRDRSQPPGSRDNDPTIVRHLHDLCALEKRALADQNFARAARRAHCDDSRRGGQVEAPLAEATMEAWACLLTDPEYEREYAQFVDAMSYAPDAERIEFTAAVAAFSRLTLPFQQ